MVRVANTLAVDLVDCLPGVTGSLTLSKEALFALSIATVRLTLQFQPKTEMACRKISSRPSFKLVIEKLVHTGEIK
jgi:hypothetical protein